MSAWIENKTSRQPLLGQPLFGQMMHFSLSLTPVLRRMKGAMARKKIISKRPSGEIHRYTYGDCYSRINQLAHALTRLGVEKSDRVATLAWNGFEHMELYFAVPCVGAVIHTLNLRLSSDQLEYIINHAEDRMIFVDASLVPQLEKIAPKVKSVERYIIIGAGADFKTTLPSVLHYEDLIQSEPTEFSWPDLDENLAAGLCYTSGTTGNPKGALYSHRSQFLHAMGTLMADTIGLSASDTLMTAVPMFHANAWGLPYAATLTGAQLVFPGPHLKPADLAELLQNHHVTIAAGVPTLWVGLCAELRAKNYDVKKLRTLLVGGAAMPRALTDIFENQLGIPVMHAWGMTEVSPLGSTTGPALRWQGMTPEEKLNWKAKQGIAAPLVEMRLIGEDGQEQPWDGKAQGELQVCGPWIISSYYNPGYNDPATSTQFTDDGWFKTGDVATIDADGCMSIVDRTKDLIKSGGEWISSIAVENALMAHPAVLEAAVIGIPDEKWSERPLALIVLKSDASATADDLKLELSKNFAKFWIPESFRFVNSIAKTSVGKTDKKRLRLEFSASRNAAV